MKKVKCVLRISVRLPAKNTRSNLAICIHFKDKSQAVFCLKQIMNRFTVSTEKQMWADIESLFENQVKIERKVSNETSSNKK